MAVLGTVGFRYIGVYDATKEYVTGNVVTYDGSSYVMIKYASDGVSKTAVTGVAPDADDTTWKIMAEGISESKADAKLKEAVSTAEASAKKWAVGNDESITEGSDTDNAKAYAKAAQEAAEKASAVSGVGIATATKAGIVKVDDDTIKVDADGTLRVATIGHLLILKITFSEEFKGKAYTVTGNGEIFTGTVPNSLYINLYVHGLDTIYTVSAEYEGETYTSEVETKDFYGVYFGELTAWQATITVTVTDAVAGAVEGALVTATSTEKEYTQTTNAEGKAVIKVGKSGTYTIVAKNADGELTDTQEVVADTDKGTYIAEVSYWRATLNVTVTDKGVGVAGAKVTAASADKTYGPVATDAEGKVTIKIGKAGTYTVKAVNTEGEETNPKPVEITTAGETYMVTCTYTRTWAFLQNFADTNPDTTISYPEGYENSDFAKMHTNEGTGTVTAGDWGDFLVDTLKNLPYMVREDGVADYQLDPNDYTKKLDGTASDYNNLNYNGGAFAWINKIYMKETYTGDTRLVEFADGALEGFTAVGFTDGENELEGYWIPMGYMDASGRVLIAGTTPVASKTCDQEWAIIQGKGSRSRFLGGPILNVLRDLEYMLFKSTDIQAHAGHGRCNAGSQAVVANAVVPNGAVPGWYGTSDQKTMNKYFHSQLLGSYQQLTRDPYTLLIGGKLYACDDYSYNLNATGKTDTGITWPTDSTWQYPSHIQYLGDGLGSFPKHENTGSSATGLCDGVYGNASGTRVALRLGHTACALVGGPACVNLNYEASFADWGCGVGRALLPSAGYAPA